MVRARGHTMMGRGRRRAGWLLLMAMLAPVSVACSASEASTDEIGPAGEPVAHGAELFATTCAQCHGPEGNGAPGLASALDASGHAWHHPDAQMREWITSGKLGLGASMPGFGDVLGAEEVEEILQYVRLLWTEEQRQAQRDISERYEEGLRRFREPPQPTSSSQ